MRKLRIGDKVVSKKHRSIIQGVIIDLYTIIDMDYCRIKGNDGATSFCLLENTKYISPWRKIIV